SDLLLAHIATQGIEVNVFQGRLELVVAILAGATGGLTHMNPVGRLVGSPPKAVGLHEALQQVKAMAVAILPVPINPAGDLAKKRTGQTTHADPRQDQKAAVVGDPLQSRGALLGRPPDPSVSGSALPGSGSKYQAGQIHARATTNQIVQVLTHRPAIAEVVVRD